MMKFNQLPRKQKTLWIFLLIVTVLTLAGGSVFAYNYYRNLTKEDSQEEIVETQDNQAEEESNNNEEESGEEEKEIIEEEDTQDEIAPQKISPIDKVTRNSILYTKSTSDGYELWSYSFDTQESTLVDIDQIIESAVSWRYGGRYFLYSNQDGLWLNDIDEKEASKRITADYPDNYFQSYSVQGISPNDKYIVYSAYICDQGPCEETRYIYNTLSEETRLLKFDYDLFYGWSADSNSIYVSEKTKSYTYEIDVRTTKYELIAKRGGFGNIYLPLSNGKTLLHESDSEQDVSILRLIRAGGEKVLLENAGAYGVIGQIHSNPELTEIVYTRQPEIDYQSYELRKYYRLNYVDIEKEEVSILYEPTKRNHKVHQILGWKDESTVIFSEYPANTDLPINIFTANVKTKKITKIFSYAQ